MRTNTLALIIALAFAVILRLLRVVVRWDELTLAYAAYAEPLVRSISEMHPTALPGSWIGLHPPLFGVFHALSEVLFPVPIVWLLGSALCSIAAVVLLGRHAGGIAALVLATAPVHLLDAAEINNYPLASLAVALVIVCATRAWYWLAFATVLAGWTHLLAGVGAVAVVIWRILWGPRVDRTRLIGAVILGLLPIGGGAFRLMNLSSTWSQPDVALGEWFQLVLNTVGMEGLLLAPLVLWGLRREARAAWMGIGITMVGAILLGAAAAHQRPYLGLLAPPAAIAIGVAVARRPQLFWVVLALCTIRGGRFMVDEVQRVQFIVADQQRERAIDQAIAESVPGDTLWLVSPALQADDDKTATGEVMWRFRPWSKMPIGRPVEFEYRDYRYGQPREWKGRMVHSSTELESASFDHVASAVLARGGRIWLVLYDHQPATGLRARIDKVLQPYVVDSRWVGDDQGLGKDWLARVEAM